MHCAVHVHVHVHCAVQEIISYLNHKNGVLLDCFLVCTSMNEEDDNLAFFKFSANVSWIMVQSKGKKGNRQKLTH